MKLSEFVSETILEIEDGLATIKEENGNDFSVVDKVKTGRSHGGSIDFDVAITTTKTDDAGAKAGLSVVGIDLLGANISTKFENSAISRIKFSIGKHQITDVHRRKLAIK